VSYLLVQCRVVFDVRHISWCSDELCLMCVVSLGAVTSWFNVRRISWCSDGLCLMFVVSLAAVASYA